MQEYVLGFAFTIDGMVYMLKKERGPAGIIGKWNGIGGKIEIGELPYEAMVREFKEETGVLLTDWRLHAEVTYSNNGNPYKIYLLSVDIPSWQTINVARTIDDFMIENIGTVEQVEQKSFNGLVTYQYDDVMGNIPWMLQLCVDKGYNYVVMNIND
jgi:8-oxo-dGTP pyrophosphatase MutT (NUDIX family)